MIENEIINTTTIIYNQIIGTITIILVLYILLTLIVVVNVINVSKPIFLQIMCQIYFDSINYI